jgi:hypothetical protein
VLLVIVSMILGMVLALAAVLATSWGLLAWTWA